VLLPEVARKFSIKNKLKVVVPEKGRAEGARYVVQAFICKLLFSKENERVFCCELLIGK
jgi:hypothetical protein